MTTLELYGHAIRRMRPHLGRLAIAIAGVLLASATEVLKPWPLKIVIDNVLRGAPVTSHWVPPMPRAELLIAACVSLVILYAILGVLNVMTNYVTISIGQRMIPLELALAIVKVWLETPFEGGRHLRRIREIDSPEGNDE